jgi:O-antigen/teichoic acid export membrane protein
VLARSVTLNLVGTLSSLLIGFVSSILLARWLGPSGRGVLGEMLTVGGYAMTLAAVGAPLAVMYFAGRRESPGALLGNSLLIAALLTIVFLPLFWLLHERIADLFTSGQGGLVWVLAAALIPLTFLDWTTHNQLLGRLRFGLYNVLVVASRIVLLATVVVLVGWVGRGVAGALVANAAASVVMIAGSLVVILRLERPRLDRPLMSKLLGYGRRVQVGSIFESVNARFDVLVLGVFRPTKEVGYYVLAQALAELVLAVSRAFQSSVQALVTHEWSEGRQGSTTADGLRHHGLIAFLAMLVNVGFAPFVVLVLVGSSFRPALLPIMILLPGMWFLGTGTVAAGDLRGRGRPGLASALSGAVAVITVALDLVLIPAFGVPGAAVASAVAYVVYGVGSLLAVSRVSGIPLARLVVVTRADLLLYLHALRSLPGRLRPAPRLSV